MSVIRKNVPMAALAFFYLAFLGVEYLFDEKVALLAGAGSVAMAESVVVGISVAGFLLYPPALRFFRAPDQALAARRRGSSRGVLRRDRRRRAAGCRLR